MWAYGNRPRPIGIRDRGVQTSQELQKKEKGCPDTVEDDKPSTAAPP